MNISCDSSICEACIVLPGEEPYLYPYQDIVTGNVGEYRAVMVALKFAKKGDVILTDSLLVVNQVKGLWECRAKHLLPHRDGVRWGLKRRGATLKWVPREESLAGIVLEEKEKNEL